MQSSTAETLRPEYYYSPGAGKSSIAVEYFVGPESSYDVQTKESAEKVRTVRFSYRGFGITAMRGVADDLMFAVRISYQTDNVDLLETNSTVATFYSGWADLELLGQKSFDVGPGTIYLFGNVSLSPEKGKDATAAKDGNEASGGWAVHEEVGFSIAVTPKVLLGTDVFYAIRGERIRTDQGAPVESEIKIRNGNTFGGSIFMEHSVIPELRLVGSVGMRTVDPVDTTRKGVTSTSDRYYVFRFHAGVFYYLSQRAALELSYSSWTREEHGSSTNYLHTSSTTSALSSSARIAF